MMPGCLRTPRHSPKKYTTGVQVSTVDSMTTQMSDVALGGAKGEPGKIPRAAFEGARTLTKATRTLWLVADVSTTAMPFPCCQKPPAKPTDVFTSRRKVST